MAVRSTASTDVGLQRHSEGCKGEREGSLGWNFGKSPKVQRRRAARLDFFDFLAGVSLWRRGQLGLFRLFDFFQRGQPSETRLFDFFALARLLDFLTVAPLFRLFPKESAFAETRLFDFSKKSKSQPAARTRPSLAASAAGLTFFLTFHFC